MSWVSCFSVIVVVQGHECWLFARVLLFTSFPPVTPVFVRSDLLMIWFVIDYRLHGSCTFFFVVLECRIVRYVRDDGFDKSG